MTAVNRALTAAFDLLFTPFERLPALASLAILAALTSLAVLLVFRWTADQRALAARKRSIQAALLEMRLFSDDLPALLRAQREALGHTAGYLRLSLVPTAWVIVPILLLMLQMEPFFGYTGLTPGEAALVKVELSQAPADSVLQTETLTAPDGVNVETPSVFLPSQQEIAWRVRALTPGSYQLSIVVGRGELKKSLEVSGAVTRRSSLRPPPDFVPQLFSPSEPPVPADGAVGAVRVTYPERAYPVAGWEVGWATIFVVLTLVFAFALKGVVGVEM